MKPTDQRNYGTSLPLTHYSTFLSPKTTVNAYTLPIKAYSLSTIDHKISQHLDWEPLLKVWNTFQTHGQQQQKSFFDNNYSYPPSHIITTLFVTYMDPTGTTSNITHTELIL